MAKVISTQDRPPQGSLREMSRDPNFSYLIVPKAEVDEHLDKADLDGNQRYQLHSEDRVDTGTSNAVMLKTPKAMAERFRQQAADLSDTSIKRVAKDESLEQAPLQ